MFYVVVTGKLHCFPMELIDFYVFVMVWEYKKNTWLKPFKKTQGKLVSSSYLKWENPRWEVLLFLFCQVCPSLLSEFP